LVLKERYIPPPPYTVIAMPRESTLKLTPLPRGKESLGQRLARFRKERGYPRTELAAKIGLIQALISDYERVHTLKPVPLGSASVYHSCTPSDPSFASPARPIG
jgi:hypothetical protein